MRDESSRAILVEIIDRQMEEFAGRMDHDSQTTLRVLERMRSIALSQKLEACLPHEFIEPRFLH